jgi:hypothetical protein
LSEVAGDAMRWATALREAQYDRRATDLPLLRLRLQHEARYGASEEHCLAAVLVGLCRHEQDRQLLHSLHAASSMPSVSSVVSQAQQRS